MAAIKLSYCAVVRVSRAGFDAAIAVVSASGTTPLPSDSDQSATNSVDHRLEPVVRAELLIHMVEVIANGLR